VRVALGAQSSEVVWLILRSGLRLTLIGAGIGLLGSIGLVQLVASFLPDTPVRDPLPIIAVTFLLLGIALVACWLPARRASHVDPIVALRTE
jgi:ABC-type antimicrobial peptide transport system permease subunit